MPKKDALARALRMLVKGPSRSPLHRWMRQNYSGLEKIFAELRPDSRALADEFATLGIFISSSHVRSPERVRKTWLRLQTEMKRLEVLSTLSADATKSLAPIEVAEPECDIHSSNADERPYAGIAAPAVLYRYSPDRRTEHPRGHLAGFAGVLHADGYAAGSPPATTDAPTPSSQPSESQQPSRSSSMSPEPS